MRQPKVLPLGEDLGGAAIAIAIKAQPHPLAVVHKNIQKFFPLKHWPFNNNDYFCKSKVKFSICIDHH